LLLLLLLVELLQLQQALGQGPTDSRLPSHTAVGHSKWW
jgi:hypothetical protein